LPAGGTPVTSAGERLLTAREIADALGARLEGAPDLMVGAPCHPTAALRPEDLILLFESDMLAHLADSPAAAAVVAEGLVLPPHRLQAVLWVGRPRYALSRLLPLFAVPPVHRTGIHPSAVIDGSAAIGAGCAVGPFVAIGPGASIGDNSVVMSNVAIGAEVRLGAGCLLYPGVRIGDRCRIGDRVILHNNVSIGADGFSFTTPERGAVEDVQSGRTMGARNRDIRRIPSLGAVVIGDDVEIGANSAVDRGTVGDTRIGRGSKIDNLVMIGHNCLLGEDCLIAGQVGISGSCRIGDRVVLGGAAGIADHVTVGDDAVVMARAAVPHDVPPATAVGGMPAIPQKEFHRQLLYIGRLKRMFEELKRLGQKLAEIERRIGG
jgi:UDP-3-O-[3-hydroxymyristoyl] glucosamine N-acyltransferase